MGELADQAAVLGPVFIDGCVLTSQTDGGPHLLRPSGDIKAEDARLVGIGSQ